MEGPISGLRRFEVGRRDVQDHPPSLGQLDGPALRVGLVAVAQRTRTGRPRMPASGTMDFRSPGSTIAASVPGFAFNGQ